MDDNNVGDIRTTLTGLKSATLHTKTVTNNVLLESAGLPIVHPDQVNC